MVKSTTIYQGELHCQVTHAPSGSSIETDAPKDNQGKGERFSPTDLLGAALGSCMLTTMAMVADRHNVSLQSARAEVEKEMLANPRRIGTLRVKLTLPKAIPESERKKYEAIANACPVHKSLSSEIEIPITFVYG